MYPGLIHLYWNNFTCKTKCKLFYFVSYFIKIALNLGENRFSKENGIDDFVVLLNK